MKLEIVGLLTLLLFSFTSLRASENSSVSANEPMATLTQKPVLSQTTTPSSSTTFTPTSSTTFTPTSTTTPSTPLTVGTTITPKTRKLRPLIEVPNQRTIDMAGPSLLVDGLLCQALGVKEVKRTIRLKKGKGWTTTLLEPHKLERAGVFGLQAKDIIRFDYAGRGRLVIRCARFGKMPRSVQLVGFNRRKRDKSPEVP